jgi:hypothetical protein
VDGRFPRQIHIHYVGWIPHPSLGAILVGLTSPSADVEPVVDQSASAPDRSDFPVRVRAEVRRGRCIQAEVADVCSGNDEKTRSWKSSLRLNW